MILRNDWISKIKLKPRLSCGSASSSRVRGHDQGPRAHTCYTQVHKFQLQWQRVNANVREPKSINAKLGRKVKSSPDEMSHPGPTVFSPAPPTIFTRLRESGHAARPRSFLGAPHAHGFPLRRVEIIMVHRALEESRLSPTTETKRNVSLKGAGGEGEGGPTSRIKGNLLCLIRVCDQRQYSLLAPEIFGNLLAVSTRSVILTIRLGERSLLESPR